MIHRVGINLREKNAKAMTTYVKINRSIKNVESARKHAPEKVFPRLASQQMVSLGLQS